MIKIKVGIEHVNIDSESLKHKHLLWECGAGGLDLGTCAPTLGLL